MEENKNAEVEQPHSNGNAHAGDGAGESSQDRRPQLDELTRAYERARDEFNDAVRTLRAEVAKIDFEQARSRARTWVDENPTLAVFIGVGAGVLAGRLLSGAFRSKPPTFSQRASRRAGALKGHLGDYSDELGAALAYQLSKAVRSAEEAGESIGRHGADFAERAGDSARRVGKDVSKQARRAGADLSRRAEEVGRDVSRSAARFGDDAMRRADELAGTLSDTTDRSVHALEDAVDDLTKTLKKRSKKARKKARKQVDRGLDFSGTVLNAARTAVAAVVVKKVSDWMRAFR